jgi:hypothetical protein
VFDGDPGKRRAGLPQAFGANIRFDHSIISGFVEAQLL